MENSLSGGGPPGLMALTGDEPREPGDIIELEGLTLLRVTKPGDTAEQFRVLAGNMRFEYMVKMGLMDGFLLKHKLGGSTVEYTHTVVGHSSRGRHDFGGSQLK